MRALVEETNSQRSADELLKAYAGREETLLTHLRTMKSSLASAETPAPAAPPAASAALVAAAASTDTNIPHEASAFDEELQSKIEPRKVETPPPDETEEVKPPSHIDEELLSKIEERNQPTDFPGALLPGAIPAAASEDKALSTSSRSGASSGVSEELLSKMEAMQNSPNRAEKIASSEDSRASPAHIDDELLNRMEQMKDKETSDTAEADSAAVEKTSASSPQIDEELQARMEEMKASPKKIMEKSLSSSTSTSRIDQELLSRMEQMKTKEEKDQETIRDEVAALVEETNPGKTAEELLLAYEGREGDLIHSLQKLKAVKATKRDIV